MRDRITRKFIDEKGKAYYLPDCSMCEHVGTAMCDVHNCHARIHDRLGAYEDSCFTPAELAAKGDMCAALREEADALRESLRRLVHGGKACESCKHEIVRLGCPPCAHCVGASCWEWKGAGS